MAKHTRFEKLVTDAKKRITEISPADAAAKSQSGEAIIVDVREKDEWDEGHIPGAIHMSRGTIELDIEEKVPDTNAMIVVTAAVAADLRSLLRACRKWATKTSTPWPAVSKHGKLLACQRKNSYPPTAW
jgi:3-mercaptopyruvate sulfurtransferase SseA